MVVGEILASFTELYKEDPQLNLIPRKGVGELLISSHGDDQRIFLGLKSSILGFFGGGNNLKICGGTHVSPGHVVLQMKYNQIGFATFGPWIFWSFDFAPISSSLLLEIQSNLSPCPPPWEPNTDTLNWLHEKFEVWKETFP